MSERETFLSIEQIGQQTIVRLRDGRFPAVESLPEVQNELQRIILRDDCQIVTFDLTDVPQLPSSMLGFFVWLRKKGRQIELFAPSPGVREYLEVTKLDKILKIRNP